MIVFGILVYVKFYQVDSLSNSAILTPTYTKADWTKALILSILLIIFFGTRDPFSPYFADTVGYTQKYNDIKDGGLNSIWYKIYNEDSSEILWAKIMIWMAMARFNVSYWYIIIAAAYIIPILFSVRKLFYFQTYTAILFAFLNFGFYSYGTNGIRNGVGLSIVLLGLSYLVYKHRNLLTALVLFTVAYEIHNSTILPSICILASVYLIKNPKWAILLWLLSILVSLTFGNSISGFFESFGFDNRLTYITEAGGEDKDPFSAAAGGRFRWDFLLFSMAPILWGSWVFFSKGLKDRAYEIIYCSYVLANSFWIIVIRAGYSNRFATLSWFLYFLVIAYPLLKFNIVTKQGQLIGIILISFYLIQIVL